MVVTAAGDSHLGGTIDRLLIFWVRPEVVCRPRRSSPPLIRLSTVSLQGPIVRYHPKPWGSATVSPVAGRGVLWGVVGAPQG